MNLILGLILCSLVSLCACSVIIKELPFKSYEVDQMIKIEWNSKSNPPSNVTIDLINDRPEVLLEPFLIGQNIPSDQEQFNWKIPKFMKTSDEYRFRVYAQDSVDGMKSVGSAFRLTNPNPGRQSTLSLIEPTGSVDGTNLESTCLLGEQCTILWDYPDWASTAMPQLIDIKLYADDKVLLLIGSNVPVNQKSLIWQVPNDSNLKGRAVHVVVMASGRDLPVMRAGSSYYLAASGFPFELEGRDEREARRLERGKFTDFNAPGPIATATSVDANANTSTLIDIPRPTYKADDDNIPSISTSNVNTISASKASKIEITLTTLITSAIGSLFILLI